jgi:hypothetical protein
MKKTTCLFALSALIGPSVAFATTATSLSSFGGIEEPTVKYTVSSNSFSNDSYVNITDEGSGQFKMYLRYSTSSWDGDRNTTSTDRQRAEIKVLGNRQGMNETFEYASTWRTNSTFKKGSHFCHVTQVKAYDGSDTSDPLVTTDINSSTSSSTSGELRASINGDSLSGKTGIKMYRNGATQYQPKWGLYRGVDSSQSIGNDYLEHKSVTANKI